MSEDNASSSAASARNLPDRRHHRHSPLTEAPVRVRPVPIARLLLYYAVVAAILGGLAWLSPVVRHAYLSPIDAPIVDKKDLLNVLGSNGAGVDTAVSAVGASFSAAGVRTLTTALVVIGALVLVLPVAWVYMFTKRLRYDASLVQSVIILPVVITGVLMIVKNSVALAFSLAGIVAAVRFRNTLKDPKDAVYIFLALAIGIASGVQAIDIALVLSLAFNLVVLGLWKFNVGAIYSNEYGPRGILNIGDRRLMVAQEPEGRREIKARITSESDGMKADGILLVHTTDPESARHAVESSLSQISKDWKLARVTGGSDDTSTLEYLVRLKKKASVVDLLIELDDRWPLQVAAAEFVPGRLKKGEAES